MSKRICSIFLLLTLLLALLPLQANAVNAGMAALDMQEISRTEYRISKDVKEYEWLLNNGSLTKQMVGHVMEIKVGQDSTATLAAGYSYYNIEDIKNGRWAMVTTTEQAQAMETQRKVNVVGAVNGGGFDMSNGRPSGALVLDGNVIQSANSTTFWVDKENNAYITDGTEYNQAVAEGRVSEAISSFGDILKDGKAFTGLDNSTRASRTAVGIKADGSVVLFMVDGRQSPYSAGMTMAELAAAMEELGCERAINLDGGGSSTFATQREGDVVSEVDPNGKSAGLTLRCRPSDGYERRVSNTLMVLSSAEATGKFARAVLTPNNEIYTPGSTVAFKASGVDGGGFPTDIPAGASWSLTEGAALGSINAQTGVFTANEGAEGTVTAALTVNGEVAGKTQIQLHWPDTLGFTNNSVSLDFGETSDMTFKPTWNGREVRYKDGDFEWSLDESEKISYKYTALVEEKGYGFSKKWSGGKPFKWTGPNLDQEKTPWGVVPKIFMSLTGNIGETQMIEWGAGDGSTYQTYFTEKSASYQVGADGTITVQELLTHDKAEKLTDDGWEECTEEENAKLVHLEHTFALGQFENNQFVADKKNSLRATAQVVLKAKPSVNGSVELVVGLEPLVLFDFEAPADGKKSIEEYWNTYVEPGPDNHPKNNGHDGQLSAEEIQSYRLWVRSGAGRTGADYSGSGVVTGKENGVRFGEGAYKLAYDFTKVSATAPIAADFGYSCDLLVNMQQPTKIGMWVNVPAARKNDDSILKVISAGGANSTVSGNGYNKLNADGTFTFVEGEIPSCVTMYSQYYGSVVDEKGNTVVLSTLSDMAGRGWIWVEADISSMQMPIDLYRAYAVHLVSPQNAGKLTEDSTTKDACKDAYILIDNIQFIYGTNTNDINNPAIESVTETTTNTVLYDGQEPEVTGSSLNFTVNYSDSEATDKYASGIDTASTRVYIDGVNQTANAEINTGSLYLRNLNLRNGEHSLTVYLKDLYGNETNTTYYFRVVDPEGTEAGIAVVPQQAAPEIGKEFALYVVNVTNEMVSSADLEIEFPASYLAAGVTVEAASGYTASLGTVSGNRVPVHIEASPIATQMARTVQEYDHEMACLVLTIPESAASDKYFEYSIAQATYQTPSGRNTFVGSAQRVTLATACELHVDRTLLVGTQTTLRVTDRSGEPQARASIYAGETLLGRTGPDGTLKYTFTRAGLQTLHAVSSAGRSQNASAVVCAKPEVNEGLPFGVQNNAIAGASTAQSITWLSSIDSSAEKAVIRYAENAELTGAEEFTGTSEIQFFVESTSGNALRCNIARLSGLSSGTTYYYQVGDGTKWSEIFHFTTADPAEQTTSFFILGDIQTSKTDNLERALLELCAGSYDFGIQTGDAIDDVTKFENWQSFFTVVNQKNLNGTALVHAMGNHEYQGDSNGEVSSSIFDLPQSGPNLWYAVEYGDVCVVVVNHQSQDAPNGSLVDATAEIAEQLKTDCSWKVLVTHAPVYGTEGVLPEASIKAIAANLEKAGIDFVFSGDDNSYTRTYPMLGNVKQAENSSKGIVYYICGDLSGKTATCTPLDCHVKVIERTEYQGLYMTAEATRESMTIRAYRYDGTLLDTYTKKRTDCELGKHTFNSSSLYDMQSGTITCTLCDTPVDASTTDCSGVLATTDGKLAILTSGALKKNEFSSFGEKNYHSCASGYAYETVRTDERTCIKGGRTTDTCPECGAKDVSQFLYPLGHDWDDDHVCRKCGFKGIDIASDAVVFKFGTPEKPRTGTDIPQYAYQPGGIRPSSFGKHGDHILTSSNDAGVGSDGIMKDLYVQWPNNKDIGTAKIVYEGKGNYYGTVELTYVIIPARVEKLNVTEITETTAKLTWSAAPGATYYKVYSCDENAGNRKELGTTESCEFVLTGLVQDETTYYVVKSCAKAPAENNKEYSSGNSPVCAVSALPLSADVTAMTATVDGVQIPAVQVDGTNYLFLPSSANLASLNAVFTRSAETGDLVVTGDLSSQNVSSTDSLNISALASETDGYRTITAKIGNGTAFTVRVMQATSLPTVYLTSTDASAQGRAYVDASKQNTTTAALRMIDANGGEIAATNITELKARGNSTFTYAEKKSYQIKLETASNLLQTGENVKTWVLLANYFDATLMHDKLFKDMAASLQMPYTASCNWVNLYYDGEYRGVYLLSEKNTVKSTGVNITDMEDAYKEQNPSYGTDMQTASSKNAYGMTYFYTTGLTEPGDITGGYLLELNHDRPDEVSGFITRQGKGMNVKSPEWCGEEAMRYISEYYQAFEDAVYATDKSGNYTGVNAEGKHYYDYVDRDSLVKIFLMQELALNPDGFISSLYFYKDAGKKMYAGPIWDQDMTLGTGWTKQISPETTDYHYLAQALIQIPDFHAAVLRCYTETFAPLAKELLAENGAVNDYAARLTDSAEMNFVLWDYIRVGELDNAGHIWQGATYASVLADMRSWLTKRIAYLDSAFAGTVFEIGDVNGDGVVDIFDVYSLRRYLAGYEVEGIILANGDVNGDGDVDIFDAWALQRRLAGYED
ncbi:phosphodiester glycosidase family protein [Dysosmobacter sp.]|uniref:phosphodiester glycosidase family protein n=1 Tax=Dysosmobacter sp. TaxID=2591382 RepID=UPI002F92636E